MEEISTTQAEELKTILKHFYSKIFVDDLTITPATFAATQELLESTIDCTNAIKKLPTPSATFTPQMFLTAYARDLLINQFKSFKSKGLVTMYLCKSSRATQWKSHIYLSSQDY